MQVLNDATINKTFAWKVNLEVVFNTVISNADNIWMGVTLRAVSLKRLKWYQMWDRSDNTSISSSSCCSGITLAGVVVVIIAVEE